MCLALSTIVLVGSLCHMVFGEDVYVTKYSEPFDLLQSAIVGTSDIDSRCSFVKIVLISQATSEHDTLD